MEPKVSIVIVTWNGGSDLRTCLKSMQLLDYSNYDITVVDNASSDGTCEMLREEFPYVRLIALEKNVGRSQGLNIGTAETDGELVLHLDNDVVLVDAMMLRTLVNIIQDNENVGACGPTVLDIGSNKIQAMGGTVDIVRVTSSYQPWAGLIDDGSFTEPIDCDYIVGCAVLFRRTAMDRVGHYDSRYIVYWDDSDICIMMKECGFRVVSIPTARIEHKVNSTGDVRSAFAYFQMTKNRLIFMRKHGSLRRWPVFLLRLVVEPWPGDSKRRRLRNWRVIYPSMMKAIWWNLKDALLNKLHPRVAADAVFRGRGRS